MRSSLALAACVALVAACAGSATPSATPTPSPGTFSSSTFAIPLSLTLLDGWVVEGDYPGDIDLQHFNQDAGISSIASLTVAGATNNDPALPWPTDLYAWLDARPEFTPDQPVNVTVGGRPGIEIDASVSVPAGTSIEMIRNARNSNWLVDRNERWRFIEVRNADGTGIVIITNGEPARFEEFATNLDALLATLQFR